MKFYFLIQLTGKEKRTEAANKRNDASMMLGSSKQKR